MLFKPRHIALIEGRVKTQTRRIWKRPAAKVGGIYPIKTKLFGQESAPVGWIRVLALRKEKLLEISHEDARAEGGYTRDEFLEIFSEIDNGRNWPYTELHVTVVTFMYLGKERPA